MSRCPSSKADTSQRINLRGSGEQSPPASSDKLVLKIGSTEKVGKSQERAGNGKRAQANAGGDG